MGSYQKFRGDPEQKLFYLLNNFIGGINTEFSDDSSNDIDFESIINFDMDKLGTLNKRGGFGELTAIAEIFNKLDADTQLPNIKNRTDYTPNPENENDNVVYMKLLRNDNDCFRALSAFDGEDAYRKYQELYGFQQNRFTLLMITTKFTSGIPSSSTAWLYKCYLPELEYENGEPTDTETMTINCYKTTFPIIFSWDRNLLNLDTIEFYDKIYFTGNNECLMTFNRSIEVTSNETFASAFEYSGHNINTITYTCSGTESGDYYFVYNNTNYQFTMPTVVANDVLYFNTSELKLYFEGVQIITTNDNTGTLITMNSIQNSAYVPSGLEVRHVGFNILCNDPLHSINSQGLTTDSIQGLYVCTSDNIPLKAIPLGQKFLLNIMYTGEDNGFGIEIKEGDNALSFTSLVNSTLSTTGLKVYDITFTDVPSGEVEIKITKTGATIEPYYDYYDIKQLDTKAKAVSQLNVGDYGLVEMYNRAVFYKDDTIWFSEINNFSYIPNYNYVTLPIEPTDKITKICYFKKSYIIFTKQRIYKMTGSYGTNDFAVSPVNMSLGCHAGNTVVPIEDTLYFASPRGLYALKSSQFVEGFENVKELDLKVKKLTSDFTKYSEELSNPAIRFNGINERAYALRYKDKYLLFYNNYGDKGDYAAINGLDTLAYQFDIGAFTTYRFKEKPTFLFMVDNAIETFATAVKKEAYTEEEVLLNYNLNTVSGSTVVDSSDKHNNAIIRGDLKVNKGIGVSFDGVNDDININHFNGDIENQLDIEIETKLDTLNGATLLALQQSAPVIKKIKGNIRTDIAGGYYLVFDYEITPNVETLNDTISYKLLLYRTFSGAVNCNVTYRLSPILTQKTRQAYFRSYDPVRYGFILESGTTTIARNSDGTYSSTWVLNASLTHSLNSQTYNFTKSQDINLSPAVAYSNEIVLKQDSNLDKLKLVITNNDEVTEFYTDENIGLLGRHTWLFSLNMVDEYTLSGSIKKDGEEISSLIQTSIYPLNTLVNANRDSCYIGTDKDKETFLDGNVYKLKISNADATLLNYNFDEGTGTTIFDTSNNISAVLENGVTWLIKQGMSFEGNGYLELPALNNIPFSNGFKIEFEGILGENTDMVRLLDLATAYNNDNVENKNYSINIGVKNNLLVFNSTGNGKNYRLQDSTLDLTQSHSFKINCLDDGEKYTISLYVDDIIKAESDFSYGGIQNAIRVSNFIGKSNTTTEPNFKGLLNSFKISVYKHDALIPTYRTAIYEFDTTPTDFGKSMYLELKTKGVNMRYPQHLKKLKQIFVKSIGGYTYGEMFFTLFGDGYIVNDPKVYKYYIDENGTVVQDYDDVKDLIIDEKVSLLGTMRLDKTKLGEGTYQVRKLIIPRKCKNFTLLIYGDSDNYISFESFGFVCKLGKVKEG